jgi:hypothetical protein
MVIFPFFLGMSLAIGSDVQGNEIIGLPLLLLSVIVVADYNRNKGSRSELSNISAPELLRHQELFLKISNLKTTRKLLLHILFHSSLLPK